MRDMTIYGWVALILLLIGGFNSLLIGLFGANVIGGIFGEILGRIIYIIIGLGAAYICYLIYLDKTKKVV